MEGAITMRTGISTNPGTTNSSPPSATCIPESTFCRGPPRRMAADGHIRGRERGESGRPRGRFLRVLSLLFGRLRARHPTVATHYKIAERLIEAMDSLNVWEGREDTIPPVFTKLPASPFVLYQKSCSWSGNRHLRNRPLLHGDKPFEDMENVFA